MLTRHPDLLLEGCSGGGGRFDAGMLYYAPQIWCSDNTDAIERLRIHYGTSFGYPMSSVSAHVSVCPNHQNGRVTPFKTRGICAMQGPSVMSWISANFLRKIKQKPDGRLLCTMKTGSFSSLVPTID